MARKKKKQELGGIAEWIVTYGDMITLLLVFFVALFNITESDTTQVSQLISTFNNIGMGASTGGNSLASGRLAEMGNSIATLPSMERGRMLAVAMRKAVSLFQPEIRSNKVRITADERGLVITLASDMFFMPASAQINIDETRGTLIRLAELLNSEQLSGRKFRIEGHTDSLPTDPAGPWFSNWELSAARAVNTLHYLTDFGVQESRFQVAGFSATVPVAENATEEGRAYNRRVDIIILDEGHL
ncbi:MAG: flagellar motor protein MotB [Spirochaetes bacterium GWD1_61_31]|nr:MAG: flagellar motor protein MotB [Spirochaetes bacterium GWB1_60_80]OHD28522.1 MAG: flagellar motor protein MotB [Spirochaetes bacterium GWC1_61_12]OHD42184.1 MAG: flagellar motor protein MotB [Spirochaetes bacterium GWD1_61_31]OHD44514.1 MAG: flagellar motor protein MotB [Spirochaetes bacterium GWE1_60_18]OHD59334.1 MAG: flagellar motor protein MotB [Spirochaetes bacterium GWF1_60_12]HAP43169.1 flagellar motor protein MotB [Spirochaetaceae bacterium]